MRLIWEQNYGMVSVDDICDHAGANKGSFYHFFASKSDLAVAAFEDHWQKSRVVFDRVFSTQTPPLERLSQYCDFIYERQKEQMQRTGKVCGCPFTSAGAELSTQDENIRQKSSQILERICKYFESALHDAAREGLIEEQDHAVTARLLYACAMGILVQAKIQNNVQVVRQLKLALFRLIRQAEAKTA